MGVVCQQALIYSTGCGLGGLNRLPLDLDRSSVPVPGADNAKALSGEGAVRAAMCERVHFVAFL